MTTIPFPVADGVTDEMGITHRRHQYTATLATEAAHRAGLPLPISSQVDDQKVILFFTRRHHLNQWAEWVAEPVEEILLPLTGRRVPVIDVVLHGVPFRLVCNKPAATPAPKPVA